MFLANFSLTTVTWDSVFMFCVFCREYTTSRPVGSQIERATMYGVFVKSTSPTSSGWPKLVHFSSSLRCWSVSERNLPSTRTYYSLAKRPILSPWAESTFAGPSRRCFTSSPARHRRVSSRKGLVPWKRSFAINFDLLYARARPIDRIERERERERVITLYINAYCSFVWTAPARSLLMV